MILKRRTYLPAWTWSERATGLPTELKTTKPVFQEPACKVSSCWIQKELFFTTTEAVSLGTLGFSKEGPWALIPRALLGERGLHQASEGPSLPSHWWCYFSGSLWETEIICVCVHACTDTHIQIYLAERNRIAITCQVAFQNHSVLKWSWGKGPSSDSRPAAEGQSQAQHWAPQAWLRCLRGPGLSTAPSSDPQSHSPLASLTLMTPQGWWLKYGDTEPRLGLWVHWTGRGGKGKLLWSTETIRVTGPCMSWALPSAQPWGRETKPALWWGGRGQDGARHLLARSGSCRDRRPPLVAPPRLTLSPRPRADVCGNRLSASMLPAEPVGLRFPAFLPPCFCHIPAAAGGTGGWDVDGNRSLGGLWHHHKPTVPPKFQTWCPVSQPTHAFRG